MTRSEGEQRPVKPVYLSRTLTVEAELSAGRLYDGSTHAENASPVVVSLVSIGGAAMVFTEDESGQLTRLRIPGPEFLRLIDDAEGKLARSRRQPDSRPGDRGGGPVRQVHPAARRPGGTATGVTSPGKTAEPFRELPEREVVVIGEVALAVASVGWTPVSGGLTEVRTSEHGTRPLPASPSGSGPAPETAKEDHGG